MSKRMEPEELQRHVAEALHELDSLLASWMNSPDDADQKRAQLLSYWVKTYTGMIRRENNFNPAAIPRLARRQIVNVDFGFRVGSELGGLHYAVVMDKENGLRGDTVTVVPLGSLKEHHRTSRNKIILEDGIYSALEEKVNHQMKEARELINSVSTDERLKQMDEKARTEEVVQRVATAKSKLDSAQASISKMKKLKEGSVANVSQITTISKLRIKEPTNPQAVLNGVKVSECDMEQIEKAVVGLYISKGVLKNI